MNLVNNINKNIFRGYDIRGVYPIDLSQDVAYTVGRSFGSKLIDLGKNICVVGRDNRYSSLELSEALIKGIRESGIDVVNLGLVTTPMYYFSCLISNIESGIMVTASHNPKDDNGFKFQFDKSGNASGKAIVDFYQYTCNQQFNSGNGKLFKMDPKKSYFEYLKKNILFGDKRLKVIIDCGNATTSLYAKELFKSFPIELEMLYDESNSSFPNHHPDPTVESNLNVLKNKVVDMGFDVGIAFDGDGDRVGIIDNLGNFVNMDYFMILMIRNILPNNLNKRVLYDVKCSKVLINEIKRLGGTPMCSQVGNSFTKKNTREWDCIFGGEFSGHLYFRDKFLGFDSGMYAGIRLLELLSNTNLSLSELLSDIPKYYATDEIKILSTDDKKFDVINRVKEYALKKGYPVNDIDGVRIDLDDSWALIRASNTGPNITLRFEGSTEDKRDILYNEFISLVNDLNS